MRLGMTSPRRPGWREQVRQLAPTPNSSRLHAKLLGEGLSQCSEPCKAKQGGKTKCHAMLAERASPPDLGAPQKGGPDSSVGWREKRDQNTRPPACHARALNY